MAADTKIQWTEKTWNPVTGCTKISQGCKFCYAEGIALRFKGSKAFPNGFDVTLHPDRLKQPMTWKKPQMVFVNSMSDLFHEDIPSDFIAEVWGAMMATPRHTYQILTKRADRMQELCQKLPCLANVWLGVSIEDRRSMPRLSNLLHTPAAVRFVSAEPLLDDWLSSIPAWIDNGSGDIQWVILGGESGPKARPCNEDWIRRGVSAVRAIGAAPFVKQMGSFWAKERGLRDPKGGDIDSFPTDLKVREWPTPRMDEVEF